MSLFPKTAAGWTRSLAFPLFAACLILVLICALSSTGYTWKYVREPLCRILFVLGLILGLTCCFGKGLDREFKWCALLLAGLSALGGIAFLPALAE